MLTVGQLCEGLDQDTAFVVRAAAERTGMRFPQAVGEQTEDHKLLTLATLRWVCQHPGQMKVMGGA